MTRNEIISAFLNGTTFRAKASSLSIVGDRLFSYTTAIAQRTDDGKLLVNMTKYSRTTSTQQNAVLRAAKNNFGSGLYVMFFDKNVVGVPIGTYDLVPYANKV